MCIYVNVLVIFGKQFGINTTFLLSSLVCRDLFFLGTFELRDNKDGFIAF